jgi:hypothetical protein
MISLAAATNGLAQVVLNEVVKEERSISTGGVVTDTREFI